MTRSDTLRRLILCSCMFVLTSCASVSAENPDPLEKYNRTMFAFNESFDRVLLKPVAKAYNAVIPSPARKGVYNFFSNLNEITTVANDILQLDLVQALSDTWRFGVNSTVGILGFIDVAKHIGLERNNQDFGLTLARWGIMKNSPYFVMPVFGPSTVRDTVGWFVDYYAFSVYPYIEPDEARYGLTALNLISLRAQILKTEEMVDAVSVDRYIFVRNAYLQYRDALIKEKRGERVEDVAQTVASEEDDWIFGSAPADKPRGVGEAPRGVGEAPLGVDEAPAEDSGKVTPEDVVEETAEDIDILAEETSANHV